jgi:hypothetical protein
MRGGDRRDGSFFGHRVGPVHVVSAIQASRAVKEELNTSCEAKYSSSAVDHDSFFLLRVTTISGNHIFIVANDHCDSIRV